MAKNTFEHNFTVQQILSQTFDSATKTIATDNSGGVASGTTDSGNPTKVGGKYNATPPTLTDGQRGDLQLDVNGNTKVTQATLLAGEDQTNNVIKTEQRFTRSGVLTSDTLVKSGAGFIHTITISQNDAAPTAGTIDIIDNTTAGSSPKIWTWTLTTAVFFPFTITLDQNFATGLYVDFTTTADVAVVISYR